MPFGVYGHISFFVTAKHAVKLVFGCGCGSIAGSGYGVSSLVNIQVNTHILHLLGIKLITLGCAVVQTDYGLIGYGSQVSAAIYITEITALKLQINLAYLRLASQIGELIY